MFEVNVKECDGGEEEEEGGDQLGFGVMMQK